MEEAATTCQTSLPVICHQLSQPTRTTQEAPAFVSSCCFYAVHSAWNTIPHSPFHLSSSFPLLKALSPTLPWIMSLHSQPVSLFMHVPFALLSCLFFKNQNVKHKKVKNKIKSHIFPPPELPIFKFYIFIFASIFLKEVKHC